MEAFESRFKRKEKKLKRKFNIDVDDLIAEQLNEHLVKPKANNLLPCILLTSMASAVCSAPAVISWAVQEYVASRRKGEIDVGEIEEVEPVSRPAPVRLEPVYYDMATDVRPVAYAGPQDTTGQPVVDSTNGGQTQQGEWTMEAVGYLIRLSTNKFPTGTTDRWEKIGAALHRKPADITAMIGKLKHMDPHEYQKLASCDSETPSSTLYCDATVAEPPELWSQSEQKLLEQAIVQFPKGTPDRWDNIARCVPGKTKEECLARFKHLAEMVRQRKRQDKS